MKIFANTKIWKKLVIIFTLITSLSFVAPKQVEAAIPGGSLMEPICSFLVGVGDGVMDILHESFLKAPKTVIHVDMENGIWETIKIIFLGVVAAVIIASVIASGLGTITAPIVALLGKAGATAVAAGAIIKGIGVFAAFGGIFGSVWLYDHGFWGNNEVSLPIYSITPEQIFRNDENFPLFNVNFFDPPTDVFEPKVQVTVTEEDEDTPYEEFDETVEGGVPKNIAELSYTRIMDGTDDMVKSSMGNNEEYKELMEKIYRMQYADIERQSGVMGPGALDNIQKFINTAKSEGTYEELTITGSREIFGDDIPITGMYYVQCNENIYKIIKTSGNMPSYYFGYTKNTLKSNNTTTATQTGNSQSPSLSGEIMNPGTGTGTSTDQLDEEDNKIHVFSYYLRDFIAAAYVKLRIIALVGMMSVLVYIGIRIVLSSSNPQKAKYKQMIGDWVTGMILLFTLHYIMNFSTSFVDEISRMLNSINPTLYPQIIEDHDGKIADALDKLGYNVQTGGEKIDLSEIKDNNVVYKDSRVDEDGKTKEYITWYTNLMGAIRVRLNYNCDGDSTLYIGYTIMFLVMVILTVIFTWTYLKRIIYMAFLTLIAPLVALTYPIDKINDGSAQGFNYWLKEYIFNLLLQPLHLLIYTILVSAAVKFSSTNIVYSLVALGFIASAEKIVRTMFNFQKAHTPGVLAGPAGAAMTMAGMKWLFGHGPNGGRQGDNKGLKAGKDENGDDIISTSKKTSIKDAFEGTQFGEEGVNQKESISNENDGENIGFFDTNNTNDLPMETWNNEFSEEDEPESTDDNSRLVTGFNSQNIYDENGEIGENVPENMNYDIPIMSGSDNNDFYVNPDVWAIPQESISESNIGDSETEEQQIDSIGEEDTEGIENEDDEYIDNEGEQVDINDNSEGWMRRKIKGIRAAGETLVDSKIEEFNNSHPHPGRDVGRFVAGAAAATAFGIAGLATGVASGDAKSTFQYSVAAGAGGYKLGKGVASKVTNSTKLSEAKEAYDREVMGEKAYQVKQAQKNQSRFINSEENIKGAMRKLKVSRKEAKQWLKEKAPIYMDEGIKDLSEMIDMDKTVGKTFKYRNENGKVITGKIADEKQAIAAQRIAKSFNTESAYGKKKQSEVIQKIQDMGVSRQKAEGMFYAAETFNDVKNNRYQEDNIKGIQSKHEEQSTNRGKKVKTKNQYDEMNEGRRIKRERARRERARIPQNPRQTNQNNSGINNNLDGHEVTRSGIVAGGSGEISNQVNEINNAEARQNGQVTSSQEKNTDNSSQDSYKKTDSGIWIQNSGLYGKPQSKGTSDSEKKTVSKVVNHSQPESGKTKFRNKEEQENASIFGKTDASKVDIKDDSEQPQNNNSTIIHYSKNPK